MQEISPITHRRAMAGLVTLPPGIEDTWETRDFPEMLAHQWIAPLTELCSQLPEMERESVEHLFAETQILTYGQLLSHNFPPVVLLELVRQHFKNQAREILGVLPMELARLLYYLTVVVGITRVGRWFSQLNNQELRAAIHWSLSRPWIDDTTRLIFLSGQLYLEQMLSRE